MLLKEKYAYKGSLAEKRAFAGSKSLTVRLANGASIDERISMTAPMGRFRIINKASGLIPFEIGRVRVSYTNGIWGGHNMNTGEPVIRWNNVGFSSEPSATVDGELAFDNLFVSSTDDETFNILLEIYDTDGNLAARVKNIEFPVRRGHVTDIIGDFCNILEEDEKPVTPPGGGGGIGIDPGFDHQYTIIIKK